jgi:fused signal recognition particle receptor
MLEGLRKSLNQLKSIIQKTELKEETLNPILWDFKIALLENDVGLDVAEEICDQVKKELLGTQINRSEDKRKVVDTVIRDTLYKVLHPEKQVDLIKLAYDKRAKKELLIIVFLGVNGTGKTTTIGKVANLLLKNDFSVVLAAADTYRAGSIEQLEGHAKRLGIRLIRHEYGSDAAAVAFDAINHARTHGINSVLIDTAGRMQTNKNLMEEMQKIVRVTNPDLVIYVGDALTGNDAVAQAEQFNKLVRVDATILTKVDADAKGGSAISISYVTKRPTIYLGVGQAYDDLIPFTPEYLIKKILD